MPGIGPKGAQRIILELKDKIATVASGTVLAPVASAAWQNQVQAGLVGLGWSTKEADKAVLAVVPDAEAMTTPDIGALLRLALRTLSRS